MTNQITGGESVMSHFWSGTSYQALQQLKDASDWQFETIKDGIPVGSDTIVIPKNAPHPNTAMLFLNCMLAPENSAANPPYIGYPMMTNAGTARTRRWSRSTRGSRSRSPRSRRAITSRRFRLGAAALQQPVGQDQGLSEQLTGSREVGR